MMFGSVYDPDDGQLFDEVLLSPLTVQLAAGAGPATATMAPAVSSGMTATAAMISLAFTMILFFYLMRIAIVG
jgi:hypothetical protein